MDILFNLDGALQLDFVHIPIAEAMTLKAGDYVEEGDKKGLLLHDGLVGEAEIIGGVNCIHAQIVVGGYVDERKIRLSTGKAVTDEIKAALPNITFCDNAFPGGGGGGEAFYIKVTRPEDITSEYGTCDKTLAEIVEAYKAGKSVIVVDDYGGNWTHTYFSLIVAYPNYAYITDDADDCEFWFNCVDYATRPEEAVVTIYKIKHSTTDIVDIKEKLYTMTPVSID